MRSTLRTFMLVALFASSCTPGGDDIVIGVIGPSSGPYSGMGTQVLNGAKLAVEQINRRGGVNGRDLRLAVRDDSDYSRIVTLMRDLVQREKPVAVIGPENVAAVRTENNPLARAGIPTLSIGGSAGEVEGNPYLFRLSPSNASMAASVVEWLVETRLIKKVSIASSSDEWGRDGATAVAGELKARGIEASGVEELTEGTVDLAPLAQTLRASGAEAVVIWARPGDAARLATSIRQIGWGAQLAGPDVLLETEFRSNAGQHSENVVLAVPRIEEERWFSGDLRNWFLEYHRSYTIVPIPDQSTLVAALPVHALTGYDAVMMIVEALISSEGDSPGRVAAALESSRHQGVVFEYDFSDSGEGFAEGDVTTARFLNHAFLYDVTPEADSERQIAFYKVQVSGFYVPERYLDTSSGQQVVDRVLEEVLTNPDEVEFFRPYTPPKPPPGPL